MNWKIKVPRLVWAMFASLLTVGAIFGVLIGGWTLSAFIITSYGWRWFSAAVVGLILFMVFTAAFMTEE